MYPNPQARWSPKTVVLDCLLTNKYQVARHAWNALESASPQVRQACERVQRAHFEMATELWDLARRRGYYPNPPASVTQHEQYVGSQFQPVGGPGQASIGMNV